MESPWRSFVPHHVLSDLYRHPRRSPIGREQRMAVVALFADVSGFTAVSEALARTGKHSAEELTAILNRYFEPMIALVESYGGIIGKFGGDAMTILFPFDAARVDATVRRAIQCAADMQGRMGDYVDMPTSVGAFSLAMKAGLAMGEVLCTTVGDLAARLEYIIAGHVLDACAEAEHHAGKGEVVVHNDLLAFAADALVVEARDDFTCVAGLGAAEPPAPLAELKEPTARAIATIAAYLHPALAEGLRANQLGFINEHRHVVVMFVRFGGFDYDHDPEVNPRLQSYFGAVVDRIQHYDGYLNKIDMGDKGSKYIVLFGAPVAHEDDAERALRCALELRDLAPETTAIGINAGLVFCGLVGSSRRREYTVMGDPVNLAARLMQAARPGQIMAGANAQQAAVEPFSWADLLALQVKGKSAPVAVWELQGLRSSQQPGLSEPRYSLPLVGRRPELALAGERLRQAARGRPAIIGITAEAGMGKSRLGSAVIEQARQQGMLIYAGACQSFGTRTSYLVWHTIWQEFFELDPHADLAEHSDRLGSALARIDPRLVARLPLLGPVLNLPLPENDFTRALDGQLRTELTRALLLACLRARAAGQPLLFVLEDMHWSDSLSLDLLEFLARNGDHHPVVFLLLYRLLDGDHPIKRLMRLGHAREIVLAEFSPGEAAALIRLKLTQHFGPAQAMPDVLVERINGRASGNPFFIEELLNYIRDRGIDPSDSAAVEGLDLPNSLQNVIISRIDQLLSEEKITLKVASVIGRLFRARWLWGGLPEPGQPGGGQEPPRRAERARSDPAGQARAGA
jgi:adenylate cyclase